MAKKQTLLEEATKVNIIHARRLQISNEHIELAVAWAKDEIALVQVTKVLFPGSKKHNSIGGRTLYSLAVYLREAVRRGLLVEK